MMSEQYGQAKEMVVREMPVESSHGSDSNQDIIERGGNSAQGFQNSTFDNNPIPPQRRDIARTKKTHKRTLGKLKFRGVDDEDPSDWWFASTAIPLIAATFAPMANLLSIAALVVSWRNNVDPDDPAALREMNSDKGAFPDPDWCINLNIASLVCGFVGNLFLLFNFTRRVRYIVALPATIVLFFVASGILIGITAAVHVYAPPVEDQIYSQGYWHAIIAATLYMLNSLILLVNMLGYFLGHYPQHFTLTDEQRNLILQTMMFFIWLGGGAAVFNKVEGWSYPDALYFCDVTILTIGFGDYYANTDTGRGLVFPYSVGGTIILGLMVSSIHKFAGELSKDKVLRNHVETRRVNTLSRAITVTDEEKAVEGRARLEQQFSNPKGHLPTISSPLPDPTIQQRLDAEAKGGRQIGFEDKVHPRKLENDRTMLSQEEPSPNQFLKAPIHRSGLHKTMQQLTAPVNTLRRVMSRSQKTIIMKEEKDRFEAMRSIQQDARQFKKWYALFISVIAFALLWCVGAVVFWQAEADTQGLSYFQALYFCYVSLLTIGYGDLSPKSNAGKPFFVVWSLIAVPTMTILVSDMGDTIIASFKRGTFRLADFTVLPKAGLYRNFVEAHPWLFNWLSKRTEKLHRKKGLPVGPVDEKVIPHDRTKRREGIQTIEQLATETLSDVQMTRRLAFAIRKVADDRVKAPGKHYSYEEWVDFTRLIRFSKLGDIDKLEQDEEIEGVVEWDWLDENSPMLSEQSESEWVLDRLCESLLRMLKKGLLAGKDESLKEEEITNQFGEFDFRETHPRHQNFGEKGESKEERHEVDDNDDDEAPIHNADNASSSEEHDEHDHPKQLERRRSALGADAILTFFTGERRGTHAYAREEPQWSRKAMERKEAQQKQRQEQIMAAAAVAQGGVVATAADGNSGAGGNTGQNAAVMFVPAGGAVRRGPFRQLDTSNRSDVAPVKSGTGMRTLKARYVLGDDQR